MDAIAEIKDLYYKATRQTIQKDLARAIDLLKTLPTDDDRERVAVYMDGLSQMRSEWAAASKGGVKMLTRGMCADWGRHSIQVNGLAPGYIVTEMNRPLIEDPSFDEWVRRRTPAGRWGETEELVGAAVFLSSAASDFVNGQVLTVDGGFAAVI